MSPRRTRIQKVIEVREKELDKRVATLSERRAAEARALSEQEQRKSELEQASESRLKLAKNEISAKNWVEANEWLTGRRLSHEKARVATALATGEAERAKGEVLSARSDLKKVELLSKRIRAQEHAEERRVEQKLEDELGSLRFRAVRKDGK